MLTLSGLLLMPAPVPGQFPWQPQPWAAMSPVPPVRAVSKTPCEKLMGKGGLSLGSSASLPGHAGSRESVLHAKILFPGRRPHLTPSWCGSAALFTCSPVRACAQGSGSFPAPSRVAP